MASRSDSQVRLLDLAQRSYTEVLAATKHEDDKVGRFLTAIAFLVAGALLFMREGALRGKYEVGGVILPLPAIGLALFLITVLSALLLLVAATSAPLTIPPRGPGDEDGEPDERLDAKRSYLYFEVIARKNSLENWRRHWPSVNWDADTSDVEEMMLRNYIDETWNLATRVRNKRKRTTEASSLFFAALLFFGLTVGLAVHSHHMGSPGHRHLPDPIHPWSLGLRLWLVAGLGIFLLAVLYQRYRQSSSREPANRRLRGYKSVAPSGVVLAAVPMLAVDLPRAAVCLVAIGTVVTGGLAGWGMATILTNDKKDSQKDNQLPWISAGLIGGLTIAAVVALDLVALQLGLAVLVALSPLGGQVWESWKETCDLRKARGLSVTLSA